MQKFAGEYSPLDNLVLEHMGLCVINSTLNWIPQTTGNQCNSCNKGSAWQNLALPTTYKWQHSAQVVISKSSSRTALHRAYYNKLAGCDRSRGVTIATSLLSRMGTDHQATDLRLGECKPRQRQHNTTSCQASFQENLIQESQEDIQSNQGQDRKTGLRDGSGKTDDSGQYPWSIQEYKQETHYFLLLLLGVTLWNPRTRFLSRQVWKIWWATHSQRDLVRIAKVRKKTN